MKRFFALLVSALMLLALAACNGKELPPASELDPQPSVVEPPPVDEPDTQPQIQEPTLIEDTLWIGYPADEQAGMEYQPLDAGNMTATQRDMVETLVNRVLAGYNDGLLPLPATDESEFAINEAIPEGETVPDSAVYNSLHVQNFDEMWQLLVVVPFATGGQLSIYLNNVHTEDLGYGIQVVYVQFGGPVIVD